MLMNGHRWFRLFWKMRNANIACFQIHEIIVPFLPLRKRLQPRSWVPIDCFCFLRRATKNRTPHFLRLPLKDFMNSGRWMSGSLFWAFYHVVLARSYLVSPSYPSLETRPNIGHRSTRLFFESYGIRLHSKNPLHWLFPFIFLTP